MCYYFIIVDTNILSLRTRKRHMNGVASRCIKNVGGGGKFVIFYA